MTLKGGTNQACAACKYQRRKCASTCVLAPYFPPDQNKMFLNVHKLFGVKKIQRLLQVLPPSKHDDAMNSIIFEANIRDHFPVFGCWGVTQDLKHQIQLCEEELYAVQSLLNIYRQQHEHEQQQHMPPSDVVPVEDFDGASELHLGVAANMVPVSQNHSYSSGSNLYNPGYLDVKETLVNSLWNQQIEGNEDVKPTTTQLSQLAVTPESLAIQQDGFRDYDMNTCFDTIDDRQSYVGAEAYDSSSESSAKDTTKCRDLVDENELKSAAAYFSLTSVK